MGIRYQTLISVFVLGMSCAATFASPAKAQQVEPSEPIIVFGPIPEAFNQALTENSGTFQENRSIFRQTQRLFGLGGYPERNIARDAKDVSVLYQVVLRQQVSSGPVLRTPDLPNPFNSSVLLLPSSNPGSGLVGAELVFERPALP